MSESERENLKKAQDLGFCIGILEGLILQIDDKKVVEWIDVVVEKLKVLGIK